MESQYLIFCLDQVDLAIELLEDVLGIIQVPISASSERTLEFIDNLCSFMTHSRICRSLFLHFL